MFEPINKAHAVSEVVVFYQFAPDLIPVLGSMMGLKSVLNKDLPSKEEVASFEVLIEGGKNQITSRPSGLKLSRFRADGQLEWQLQVGPPAISVHCLDYTRWSEVWPVMRRFIQAAFQEMGAATIEISAVGLKYIDRFLWGGTHNDYDLEELFRKESELLNSRAYRSSTRWHCHTGWFDSGKNNVETLNQLNIDSAHGILSGSSAIFVTIDHTQTIRKQAGVQLSQYSLSSDAPAEMDELMTEMHGTNKSVLLSLLRDDVAKRINLKGSDQ